MKGTSSNVKNYNLEENKEGDITNVIKYEILLQNNGIILCSADNANFKYYG